MSDTEVDNTMAVGGGKKSNGHKMDCKCPICKNMMYKDLKKKSKNKSGGQAETTSVTDDVSVGGKKNSSKKSNGHKMECKCPICKNMMKKGGQQPDPKDDTDSKTMTNDDSTSSIVSSSDSHDSSSLIGQEDKASAIGNIPSGRGGKRRTKRARKSNNKKGKSKKTRKSRKSRKSKK